MRILGTQIAAARDLLKMSQAELAAASGVGESTVKRFESGHYVVRQEKIDAMREALERRGIEFLNGGRPGVRLHPDRTMIPV